MMKLICVLLIVVAVEKSYGLEDIGKIFADCKTAEKVSDADVMDFKNKVKSETKEAKCFTTCVMEKVQLLKNNQMNANGLMELAKAMPNSNEKIMQSASELADECKAINSPDRCENGFKLSECLMNGAAKRQLNNIFM